MHIALLVALLAAAGCDSNDCGAPDETTYSTAPITDGTPGCVGGPVWTPLRSDSNPRHEDPDKVFSVGTRANVPECGCCYPGGRLFECGGSDGRYGGASYSEPRPLTERRVRGGCG